MSDNSALRVSWLPSAAATAVTTADDDIVFCYIGVQVTHYSGNFSPVVQAASCTVREKNSEYIIKHAGYVRHKRTHVVTYNFGLVNKYYSPGNEYFNNRSYVTYEDNLALYSDPMKAFDLPRYFRDTVPNNMALKPVQIHV